MSAPFYPPPVSGISYSVDKTHRYSTEPCAAKTLAQQRRQLENEEFALLSRELPLARAISGQHIDKTTMVRLSVSYIKLHKNLEFLKTSTEERQVDRYWNSHQLELLDSFFLILNMAGDIVYVSETISIYLGLSQVEMMGHNVVDYIHLDDFQRFQNMFQHNSSQTEYVNLRIRSSLTKRATKDSARSCPGYKVIRLEMSSRQGNKLCHCVPLPSLVLSTVSIQNASFVLTLNLDFKICSADDRAEQTLGDPYSTQSTLKNVSFYQLIHVDDTQLIRKMHYEVFALGAYKTPFYRMLLQRGSHTFFVESNVYRYSSVNCKKVAIETVTVVSTIL